MEEISPGSRSPNLISKAFVDSDNSNGCLFGNLANEIADHSPVIRERLKSNFVGWTQVIASVIREGQESGEISDYHFGDCSQRAVCERQSKYTVDSGRPWAPTTASNSRLVFKAMGPESQCRHCRQSRLLLCFRASCSKSI